MYIVDSQTFNKMQLPIFFQEEITGSPAFSLNEEASKHISQVLRMKAGDLIELTNGKGQLLTAEIVQSHKRSTKIKVISRLNIQPSAPAITIAISLLKNTSRFEWFIEKATEIGISEIIPLICTRTEKQKFRQDRLRNILISAMLQSRQCWLPILSDAMKFNEVVSLSSYQNKFIAHCDEGDKNALGDQSFSSLSVILIGPEGDFTKEEVTAAIQNNFIPVSLGETRLRSETAAVVAATLMRLG